MTLTTYQIKSTDGNSTYTVPENTTNTDTSVVLIGHGVPEYGVDQNTNFLHLLENFAHKEQPESPVIGQLWYKKDDTSNKNELMVCKSVNPISWDRLSIVYETQPSFATTGDMWYDEISHELKVYDEKIGDWNIIGPADIIHTDKTFDSGVVESTYGLLETNKYIPFSEFMVDVQNDGDDGKPSGCLSLITMKILAKEIINNVALSESTPRCCVWIYRFVINSYKEEIGDVVSYNINMVGNPSYELLAKTDDTDWEVDIIQDDQNNQFVVSVVDKSGIYSDNSRIVVGIETEVIRV